MPTPVKSQSGDIVTVIIERECAAFSDMHRDGPATVILDDEYVPDYSGGLTGEPGWYVYPPHLKFVDGYLLFLSYTGELYADGTSVLGTNVGYCPEWRTASIDREFFGVKRRCKWFTLCRNDATHLEPHTVYGQVPCCDRCAQIGR